MDRFRYDQDLVGAKVGSTMHPHTLRFPDYKEGGYDDIADVEGFKKIIEGSIGKRIFIPDLRTAGLEVGSSLIIDESNVESHVKADAVVTQMHDRAIAMLTADCSPVLLFDPTQRIIGGIHGSMRAIRNGVIENTFSLLEEDLNVRREDVRVFVGPTICQKHYEVGEGDTEGFQDINIEPGSEGKAHLDIRGEVVYRLGGAGVQGSNIISPNVCTYGSPDRFSFRRKTHLKAENKAFTHANNGNLIWLSE